MGFPMTPRPIKPIFSTVASFVRLICAAVPGLSGLDKDPVDFLHARNKEAEKNQGVSGPGPGPMDLLPLEMHDHPGRQIQPLPVHQGLPLPFEDIDGFIMASH